MAETFTRWDAVDHLQSRRNMRLYMVLKERSLALVAINETFTNAF